MACVARARAGTLFQDLPAELHGLHVTANADGVRLHRDGRPLTQGEGEALWQRATRVLSLPGFSSGRPDIPCTAAHGTCFQFDWWICQGNLDAIAARLNQSMQEAGVSDGALTVNLVYLEANGPKCRAGTACKPAAHYSRPATYEPEQSRTPVTSGRGACHDDGDCQGQGNECSAWYLAGGARELLYIQYSTPVFCGCVDRRCTWFGQP